MNYYYMCGYNNKFSEDIPIKQKQIIIFLKKYKLIKVEIIAL